MASWHLYAQSSSLPETLRLLWTKLLVNFKLSCSDRFDKTIGNQSFKSVMFFGKTVKDNLLFVMRKLGLMHHQ